MSMNRNARHSKRVTDIVRQEVIEVLLEAEGIIEFNNIFLKACESMKEKNYSTGGEEILRLRIYEKLQTLIAEGGVKKRGKEYEPLLPKLQEIKDAANSAI